jgi:hypothetical protein
MKLSPFGDNMKHKWTDLFALMEEASNHPNRSTFAKQKRNAYNAANAMGLLDVFFPAKQWTMDKCVDEALRHDTRSGFRRAAPAAYAALERNDMLDFYFVPWNQSGKPVNNKRLRKWNNALWLHHKTNWK